MMDPKTHDLSGVCQTSVSLMNSEESPQLFHRRPPGLTITVEAIDRFMADANAQIENLRQYRINLGLVRVQSADMEAK